MTFRRARPQSPSTSTPRTGNATRSTTSPARWDVGPRRGRRHSGGDHQVDELRGCHLGTGHTPSARCTRGVGAGLRRPRRQGGFASIDVPRSRRATNDSIKELGGQSGQEIRKLIRRLRRASRGPLHVDKARPAEGSGPHGSELHQVTDLVRSFTGGFIEQSIDEGQPGGADTKGTTAGPAPTHGHQPADEHSSDAASADAA